MKFFNYMMIMAGLFIISGCAPGQTTGRLLPGQWTAPMSLGSDKYMIQGHDTEDAINGANSFCADQYKTLSTENVTPHTRKDRASITFSCR